MTARVLIVGVTLFELSGVGDVGFEPPRFQGFKHFAIGVGGNEDTLRLLRFGDARGDADGLLLDRAIEVRQVRVGRAQRIAVDAAVIAHERVALRFAIGFQACGLGFGLTQIAVFFGQFALPVVEDPLPVIEDRLQLKAETRTHPSAVTARRASSNDDVSLIP